MASLAVAAAGNAGRRALCGAGLLRTAAGRKNNASVAFGVAVAPAGPAPLRVRRRASAHAQSYTQSHTRPLPDPSLVDDREPPSGYHHHQFPPAVVYPGVVTKEEAAAIEGHVLGGPSMRRKRYEAGHWDSVISLYKETELPGLEGAAGNDTKNTSAELSGVFARIRSLLEEDHLSALYDQSEPVRWLPCHAIDLKREGELRAHVDSVRFSGHLVAGLSLRSTAVMRLVLDPDAKSDAKSDAARDGGRVDLLLPPRSLYVLTGAGRYDYSHELLPDGAAFGEGTNKEVLVRRDQRLSIIFRDAKPDPGESTL